MKVPGHYYYHSYDIQLYYLYSYWKSTLGMILIIVKKTFAMISQDK